MISPNGLLHGAAAELVAAFPALRRRPRSQLALLVDVRAGPEPRASSRGRPGDLTIEPPWLTTPLGTRPILAEVRTVLGTLRDVPQGARFGASGSRTASGPTRLGALPIGYSNSMLVQKAGQTVHVEGCAAAVLSVSLEHAVVDVTDIPRARSGAPVCLLARDPALGPPLAEVASRQGRSPLEVLASLTGRAVYEYPDG
jgi:alanine racemase